MGSNMLHVLQVCPEFPFRGGVERHVLEVSRCLRDRGVQVTVLASNPRGRLPGHEYHENIEVIRFGCWSPGDSYYFTPSVFLHLARITTPCTIVHSHSYQALPSFAAALAKVCNHLPLVFTPHFHPMGGSKFRSILKRLYRPFGKLVFDLSDVVIALSEHERSTLKVMFHLDSDKIRVVPHGIHHLCQRLREPSTNILYVGRLEKYKGVDFLIECLPEVLQHLPRATLTIVGTGPDEGRLRRIVNERGLLSSVKFLGGVSFFRLDELLRRAGLVALMSEYEAYSLIIAEALQLGVPVVATRVGAIFEIFGRDERCILLDYPPRTDELAEKIIRVLSGELLWRTNRVTPVSRLSWNDVADRLLNIYEELLSFCPCQKMRDKFKAVCN